MLLCEGQLLGEAEVCDLLWTFRNTFQQCDSLKPAAAYPMANPRRDLPIVFFYIIYSLNSLESESVDAWSTRRHTSTKPKGRPLCAVFEYSSICARSRSIAFGESHSAGFDVTQNGAMLPMATQLARWSRGPVCAGDRWFPHANAGGDTANMHGGARMFLPICPALDPTRSYRRSHIANML